MNLIIIIIKTSLLHNYNLNKNKKTIVYYKMGDGAKCIK
jgi:hypothetical protein